jgi:hypothetical protein
MASRTYWASLPGDKIIGELQERRTAYYDQVNQDGRMDCWDISQRYYYGLNSNGGYRETQVQFAGKQGEALLLSDNEYRSLLDTFHTLVCGDRMGISAMASNPSPAAVNAATLADGIVDFFSEHEGLEQAQMCAHRHSGGRGAPTSPVGPDHRAPGHGRAGSGSRLRRNRRRGQPRHDAALG